jgi:hypothetical protein
MAGNRQHFPFDSAIEPSDGNGCSVLARRLQEVPAIPHTIHEERFLDVLHFLTGREVAQEISIPRKARRLDAVCRFDADGAPGLFGPLQAACADRTVLFEHESSPLTVEKVASAWVGLAWLSWHRVRTHRGRRPAFHALLLGTPRPPLAMVVADGVREDLTDAIPWLAPSLWPGVWATADTGDGRYGKGGLLVVDTTRVPPGDGFGFWHWLGRVRDPAEAAVRLDALLGDSKLPTMQAHALQEAIMNGQIQVSEIERETVAQRVRSEGLEEGLRRGLEQGLEQGLQQGLEQGLEQGLQQGLEQGLEQGRGEGARAALLALAARLAPEALPSLRVIHDLDALQQAVDAALAQRLGG